MGREIRMVPPEWVHPKMGKGYIPLLDNYVIHLQERAQWERGFVTDYKGGWQAKSADQTDSADDYFGTATEKDFMPCWPPEVRTHYMMYEDTSEGTPISPAFATVEELARWLTSNGASAFGGMTATYEQWLRTCRGGHAPSMVIDAGGKMMSGVEACSK